MKENDTINGELQIDEGGALAQPFELFCTGIGTGAAHSAKQVENGTFDLAAIRNLNFTTLGRTVFLESAEMFVVGGA